MPRKKTVRKQPGKRLPKITKPAEPAQSEEAAEATQSEQAAEAIQPGPSTQANQPSQAGPSTQPTQRPAPTLTMSPATESKIRPEIAALKGKMAVVEKEFESAQAELQKYTNEDPDELIKRHIALLHEYNDIKDAAMGLVGVVADGEGRTIKDVLKDLGIDETDDKKKKDGKKKDKGKGKEVDEDV